MLEILDSVQRTKCSVYFGKSNECDFPKLLFYTGQDISRGSIDHAPSFPHHTRLTDPSQGVGRSPFLSGPAGHLPTWLGRGREGASDLPIWSEWEESVTYLLCQGVTHGQRWTDSLSP